MTKKSKILYLTTTSQLSGAEKMLYELVKGVNKKKYEIMVCTIKDDLDDQLLDKLRKLGIKTSCLGLNKKWKIWKVFYLYKLIKKFKPDIIQSFLYFDNILARIFGKLAKVPIIISGQRNFEPYRSKMRNFWEKSTINLADLTISNSQAGKEILISREKVTEDKVKVIYNGIDSKEIDNSSNKDLDINIDKKNNHVLGFIGRLNKQKGLKYLIKALAKLKQKNINLIIIGEGPEKDNLKKLSKELEIEDNIYFVGHRNKAWQYLNNFDLFILPSLWEGMPNVVLEAMAKKLPIIATKVGGTPELIKNNKNGFLLEPANVEELIEKINYVLSLNSEEKERIGELARQTVEEKFSIKEMLSKYECLYTNLLNK